MFMTIEQIAAFGLSCISIGISIATLIMIHIMRK